MQMKNPEKLIEEMAQELQKLDWDKDDCILAVGKKRKLLLMTALMDISKVALHVVLQSVQRGEVAQTCECFNGIGFHSRCIYCSGEGAMLKPSYKEWMEK